MTNSKNSHKSSPKSIIERIDQLFDSSQRCRKLKDAASHSKERAEIVGGLATSLERILQNYTSVISKYRLLTFVFGQVSKENIKRISRSISNLLSSRIKAPSQTHLMNMATYTKIVGEIGPLNEELQMIGQRLSLEIDAYENSWLDKITFVKHILRIPDLSKEFKESGDLLSSMSETETFLRTCKNMEEIQNVRTLKRRWEKIKSKFDRYRTLESYEGIKQAYKFSRETIPVIRGLLDGNELSLNSINPEVLKDLYKFKEFCKAIALRFKPLEEIENDI